MSNPLPPEVLAHIHKVMAEKEGKLPPSHAFTVKQYYDTLVKMLKENRLTKLPSIYAVRESLMKDETLNKTKYKNTYYFWRSGETPPAKKED